MRQGDWEVRFEQAWVERAIDEEEAYLVWFTRTKRNDWSFLCVQYTAGEGGSLEMSPDGEGLESGYSGYGYWLKLLPGNTPPERVKVKYFEWETLKKYDVGVLKLTTAGK
jgi:hypothetical protein